MHPATGSSNRVVELEKINVLRIEANSPFNQGDRALAGKNHKRIYNYRIGVSRLGMHNARNQQAANGLKFKKRL